MYHWLLLKNPTILLDNEKLEKRKNKTTSSILPSFNQSRCFPLINRPIYFASDYHVTPSTYVHMPPTFDVIADNFLQSKFLGALHTIRFLFHIVLYFETNERSKLNFYLLFQSKYLVMYTTSYMYLHSKSSLKYRYMMMMTLASTETDELIPEGWNYSQGMMQNQL